MNDDDFDELAGRIQGLVDAFLMLVSMLDRAELIDSLSLSEQLRILSERRRHPGSHLAANQRTLAEIARSMLDEHSSRR